MWVLANDEVDGSSDYSYQGKHEQARQNALLEGMKSDPKEWMRQNVKYGMGGVGASRRDWHWKGEEEKKVRWDDEEYRMRKVEEDRLRNERARELERERLKLLRLEDYQYPTRRRSGEYLSDPIRLSTTGSSESVKPRRHRTPESWTDENCVKIEIRVPLSTWKGKVEYSSRKDKVERRNHQPERRSGYKAAYDYARKAGWGTQGRDHDKGDVENFPGNHQQQELSYDLSDRNPSSSGYHRYDQSSRSKLEEYEGAYGRDEDDYQNSLNLQNPQIPGEDQRHFESLQPRVEIRRPQWAQSESLRGGESGRKYRWNEDGDHGCEQISGGMHRSIPDYPPPAYDERYRQSRHEVEHRHHGFDEEFRHHRQPKKRGLPIRARKYVKALGWLAGT